MSWPPATILAATALSQTGNPAAEVSLALARHTNAEVHLVHCIDPAAGRGTGFEPLDQLLGWGGDAASVRARAEQALEHLARRHGPPDPQRHVVEGRPGPALQSRRLSMNADLIAVGSRGLRGLRHLLVGSAADRMLRSPGCPLLLLRRRPPGGEFKQIMICAEYPDRVTPWLRMGLAMGRDLGAELKVLHVAPARGYVSDSHHVDFEPDRAKSRLERVLDTVGSRIPRTVIVERGDAASVIPTAARRLGAQLVVVGAERRTDGWPGRVADRVARSGLPAVLLVWPDVPRPASPDP